MDLTVHSKTVVDDDQSWLGSEHGTSATDTITLKSADFTGTFADGRIPSGTPVSKLAAGNLWTLYTNAGTAGAETLTGFLFKTVQVIDKAGATNNVGAAVLMHGEIVEANLPAVWAALTATPIAAGKVDVAGRIWFV